MGGPPMVEAALGLSLSANELAGVEMHERTGGIDLLVQTEPEAIEAARRYLAFTTNQSSGPASATATTIDALVPTRGGYDMPQSVFTTGAATLRVPAGQTFTLNCAGSRYYVQGYLAQP